MRHFRAVVKEVAELVPGQTHAGSPRRVTGSARSGRLRIDLALGLESLARAKFPVSTVIPRSRPIKGGQSDCTPFTGLLVDDTGPPSPEPRLPS
jgi:hypothetical protein